MTNTNALHPRILAGQDIELQYMARQTRGSRRVTLKRGESVKLRFLPAQLGPDARWYARVANHWIFKKPVVCPVHTAPEYGGDEGADCPLCHMSDALNRDTNKDVSDFGWDIRATPQWLTYCIVFATSSSATDAWQEKPLNELLLPWEFQHYKSSFESLFNFVRNNVTSANPLSVLDYERGNDFIISKQAKGSLQMDKRESEPIFDPADENYQKWLQKIEEGCKTPNVKIPSFDKLEEHAIKAQEYAIKDIGRSNKGGGIRRGVARPPHGEDDGEAGYTENDEAVEQPVSRRSSDASLRRVPESAAAPVQTQTARPVARTAQSAAQTTRTQAAAPAARAQSAASAARPVVRTAVAPLRAAPLPRTTTAARQPVAAVPQQAQESLDEEEAVAPESTDPAPPAEEAVEGTGAQEELAQAPVETGADAQEEQAEPLPPPVSAARRGGTLGTELARKITSVPTRRA